MDERTVSSSDAELTPAARAAAAGAPDGQRRSEGAIVPEDAEFDPAGRVAIDAAPELDASDGARRGKSEGVVVPEDAELIERCLRHDNAAWELIVARFRRRIFYIAYKFTGKHDDAEDLTQEILLKLFRSLDKFHRDADLGTWLSSVARNYCIDRYRAGRREREVVVDDLVALDLAPASAGNPYRALEDRDRRSFVRRGLELLPPKLREAVVLRDLMGHSYQEMAERLSLPEGTVKSRINRGREELSRLLLRAQQPPRAGRPAQPRAGRTVRR